MRSQIRRATLAAFFVLFSCLLAGAPLRAQLTGKPKKTPVVKPVQMITGTVRENAKDELKAERTDKGWVLSNGRVRYALDLFPDGSLRLSSLRNLESGFEWAAGEPTGIYLVNAQGAVAGFSGGDGYKLVNYSTRTLGNAALELRLEMLQKSTGMKITSFYTAFPEVAAIEYRCKIENVGSTSLPTFTRFHPLCIRLRGDLGPLVFNSVGRDPLQIGRTPETQELGTKMETSKTTWTALEERSGEDPTSSYLLQTKPHEFLFVAGEWGGGVFDWDLNIQRQTDNLLLHAGVGLPRLTYDFRSEKDKREIKYVLAPGESVESPEVFVVLARGDVDDACNALRHFLRKFIMPKPLENWPWITYTIWFTDPNAEKLVLEELELAAEMGFDGILQDASWYEGSSTVPGYNDWAAGLGNYAESREKYPHGITWLSQKTHEKGLKFGLWVNPDMVDNQLLKSGKIPRSWVAQVDGKDLETRRPSMSPMTEICWGNPEAAKWARENIGRLVSEWQLDMIKLDPSGTRTISCNRSDHGHKEGDGAYAWSRGLLEMYSYVLERFPDVVGWDGVQTLRYGRLNPGPGYFLPNDYTPFAVGPMVSPYVWGSNSGFEPGWGEGLLPYRPYYTCSYLDYFLRRLSIGSGFVFGNCEGMASQRLSLAPPGFLEALKRYIKCFKSYRHILNEDVYHLQLAQPEKWRATEYCKRDGSEAAVCIFREGSSEGKNQITLRGLDKSANYMVTSLNEPPGREKTISGEEMMSNGIPVELPSKWLAGIDSFDPAAIDPENRKEYQRELQYGSDILVLRKIE